MSLVVCSNKEQDGATLRQDQSIYSAWSFRNQLPSTMKIPANSQVALQSCKINVDGRVVFGRNNHRFYYYFGEKLDRNGGDPQQEDTTSYGAITTLTTADERGQIVEMSLDDFAERIEKVLNSTAYHPNVKDQISCSVLRNASGLDFLGYNIQFDQTNPTLNSVPVNGGFEPWFREDQADGIFSYTGGIFTRETDDEVETCVGICPNEPFSLNNGSFIVNISGADANVNSSGVEWHIGLSRFINNTYNGYYIPNYNDFASDDQMALEQEFFADFGVARNRNGELVVYHTAYDPNANFDKNIRKYEVQYWDNSETDFSGDGRHIFQVGNPYSKIGFFSKGEQMKVSMYNASDSVWEVITDYSLEPLTHFKPVNQSCWCLHPVLSIGRDNDAENCKMKIEEYTAVPITGYNPKEINKGGWFETLELTPAGTWRCQELETTRTWNDPADTGNTYVQKGLNASGGTNLQHILILEESNLYVPTSGANAREILGFSNSILDAPNSITGSQVIYQSDRVPSLTSSMAMFVRLNNFGQNVHNAHTGNRSKILAHLPRFDNTQSTGRLYFEPQNFVWLDLDNPSEMNVNEFDISFCYVNEQYAQILTGQSIVCLYFRKKPKELM
jgi:hypothetical protein